MRELTFTSAGVRCAAWHLSGEGDAVETAAGRPCIVMAHGFGGTRDTGLLGYAEGLAAAGFDVLLFDYRGFGASAGTPRQRVAFRYQRADYHAAIGAARAIDGVDPERIVLWGTSYSGGHVVPVAVADGRVAAVVSLTPAMDGLAALIAMARHGGPRRLVPRVFHGLRDAARGDRADAARDPGRRTRELRGDHRQGRSHRGLHRARRPDVAQRGLRAHGARGRAQPADPVAGRVSCPLLVQIGEHDTVAPPAAAHRVAAPAWRHAEVRTYPVDHFDVYDGPWHQRALADQIEFLGRHVAARPIVHNERVAA
jgi:uncharacterized protein